MKPLHISLNTAHSGCKPSAFIYYPSHIPTKSPSLYPHISPLPPPHFYRPTPNHPHSNAPHAQTTSIYPTSPPHRRSVHPKDCTNPHCVSYPSATLRIFISPSSVPFSPDFADSLSSFQNIPMVYKSPVLAICFNVFMYCHVRLTWAAGELRTRSRCDSVRAASVLRSHTAGRSLFWNAPNIS